MARKKTFKIDNKKRAKIIKYVSLIVPVLIIGGIFTWLYQTKDIVMRVGSEVVTVQELNIEMERLKPSDYEKTLTSMSASDRKDAENMLRSKAIENLMKLKSIYLYAKENNIKVTKEDIDKEIKNFEAALKESSGSENIDLKATLADLGISWKTFYKDMRDQAIYNKVLEPIIKNVTVTEEEAKEYYEQYSSYYDEPEKAHLKMIAVSNESEANEILEKLKTGEDFGKLAREKSLSPDAATNSGDIGWVSKAELYEEIGNNVFHPDIKLNTPYKIQARDGWYIFIVLEKRDAINHTYDEVKDRVKNDLLSIKQSQTIDAFMYKLTEEYEQRIILGNPWDNFLKWWDKLRGKTI
ncbi:MAG TPA: SurA N-terminal domain-containing protein [Caldisericia bacterium]|nr:SurA N-terminal domain-containing protein [Caldisericia bacterium]HPO29438.1 SurA N-terminal domain-containing protein [Caldisericia bacterium]